MEILQLWTRTRGLAASQRGLQRFSPVTACIFHTISLVLFAFSCPWHPTPIVFLCIPGLWPPSFSCMFSGHSDRKSQTLRPKEYSKCCLCMMFHASTLTPTWPSIYSFKFSFVIFHHISFFQLLRAAWPTQWSSISRLKTQVNF